MYIFGDDDKFLQKIIAISNDLQGEKGYIISKLIIIKLISLVS